MTQAAKLQQQEKAKQFYDLHHSGKLLILPNIWDPLGAMLLQDISFPAVATASAAIAYANGYDDGEKISFTSLLDILKKIASRVNIPVSADIESGYAENNIQLKENIRQLIETGIVGINIEDSDKITNLLLPLDILCENIQLIKKTSNELGTPLFINARTDVYVRGKDFDTPESKLEETLKRGFAYKEAGADCFYPITMNREEDIKKTVEQLSMPVNILIMDGIPKLDVLNKMGVARVSAGPGFLKIAIQAMKNVAMKLQNFEGTQDMIENEITSPYLKGLVNKT